MKKGIISILGTIMPPREGQERAEYCFSNDLKEKFSLKKERYTNMLPLILDNFEEYGEIRTIYTNLSKEKQTTVLDYERLDYDIEKNGLFVSENIEDKEANYSYFLDKYNELIEEYDRVIIDVSHGFRHFPILAVVNLIIQNIKNPEKIEYIFFAKEIKQFAKYEVIDLKEYLELANLSFMLSTFNQNYTVSSNIQFTNPLYKKVAKELSEFSSHFLSNSFKPLIEGKTIEHIIDNLEELQQKDAVVNFKTYIVDIVEHLEDIRQLKYKKESIKLYELSKIMDERGYQLNAITLLFEALGFYCLESIATIEDVGVRVEEFRGDIEAKEKPLHIYSTYTLVNEARVITKIRNRFKVSTFINSYELKDTIIQYLNRIENLNQFKQFIEALEALRNNLAHGNSGFTLKDVKLIYTKNLHKFEKMAIEEDMLNVNK